MDTPNDRKYAESHEWHLLDGDTLTLGITEFAVNELTDVTYVEMKEVGTAIAAGEEVGEVESVKATSEIFSQLPGEIIAVNSDLSENPSLINTDPYGAGWLVKLKVNDTAPLEGLMDAAAYDEKYPK